MWSRIKSSLQQFWSNFIWSSTCKANMNVDGNITLGVSLTSHYRVSPSLSIWLMSWEPKPYQKLFIDKCCSQLSKQGTAETLIHAMYRIFTTTYILGKQTAGMVMQSSKDSVFMKSLGKWDIIFTQTRTAEIMLMWTFPCSPFLNYFWKY